MKLSAYQMPSEIRDMIDEIHAKSLSHGLEPFPTIFEVVDYEQLNQIAAYGGFPTRYPHWRWGMEYEQLSKSYEYGLSKIYEMVINNNPCYAYLLRANNLVSQRMVIAHVYGHCDFFKNNYWFSKTNRKMLDQMANHSASIRRFIDEIGHDTVEAFIDTCLSLENLIDPYSVFKPEVRSKNEEIYRAPPPQKLEAKGYMDKFINPKDFVEVQKKKAEETVTTSGAFPSEPRRDVLKFLLENAPLASWQRKVLQIVRSEAYYFAPQGQTKILNEGWATYWHSEMMTKLAPLSPEGLIDYCDNHAGVLASAPGGFNPYKIGLELLRYVKMRWDKGRFGLDYLHCTDPIKKKNWDTAAGEGMQKLFEIRRTHNDVTFLQEYLDEDFCHDSKLFLYDRDKKTGEWSVSSRNFKEIKTHLLRMLTNFGQPVIKAIDGNYKNRGELLLEHVHEGVDLDESYANETLKALNIVWGKPVNIRTILDGNEKIFSVGSDA